MKIKKRSKIEHGILLGLGGALATFIIVHTIRSIPDMVRYYRISTM